MRGCVLESMSQHNTSIIIFAWIIREAGKPYQRFSQHEKTFNGS